MGEKRGRGRRGYDFRAYTAAVFEMMMIDEREEKRCHDFDPSSKRLILQC